MASGVVFIGATLTALAGEVLIDNTGGSITKTNEHPPLGIVLLRGPAWRHHRGRA
jgi:hypothetical protein